jgi:DNA-binding NarL/FixJ family response regulator
MTAANPPQVLLASSRFLIRIGLAVLLRQALPNAVQFEAASLEQLILHLGQSWAGLLLLDFALIGGSPDACLRRIRARAPECRILVLTEEEGDSPDLRAVGGVTVRGTGGPEDLLNGIRDCLSRGSMPVADLPIPPFAPFPAGLTSRQAEVYRLLAEGCSTKTIARRLGLAVGTVKVHLAGIYRALGATSRLEAVVKARGLMTLPGGPAAS